MDKNLADLRLYEAQTDDTDQYNAIRDQRIGEMLEESDIQDAIIDRIMDSNELLDIIRSACEADYKVGGRLIVLCEDIASDIFDENPKEYLDTE